MNQTRESIIRDIEKMMSELNLLNIRRGIYTDIITHHQKTLLRIEKRMAEIHDEVEAIKKEVLDGRTANKPRHRPITIKAVKFGKRLVR
jgi:hypothetical protein